jgi:hypothetical protein
VHEFLHESNDQWDRDGLVSTRGYDVELVRATQKLVHVERRLSSRGAGRFGAHAREESRGGRPNTRSFTILGREDATKE